MTTMVDAAYERLRTDAYGRGCADADAVPITVRLARQYLNGMDLADPDALEPRSPLSGEWAGESMPELLGDLADDADAADAYEAGYFAGWEDTLVERCSDLLMAVKS